MSFRPDKREPDKEALASKTISDIAKQVKFLQVKTRGSWLEPHVQALHVQLETMDDAIQMGPQETSRITAPMRKGLPQLGKAGPKQPVQSRYSHLFSKNEKLAKNSEDDEQKNQLPKLKDLPQYANGHYIVPALPKRRLNSFEQLKYEKLQQLEKMRMDREIRVEKMKQLKMERWDLEHQKKDLSPSMLNRKKSERLMVDPRSPELSPKRPPFVPVQYRYIDR